jgi:hypothetical protein
MAAFCSRSLLSCGVTDDTLSGLPDIPLNLTTLGIVLPVAITLALIGLLESLLTAQLLDDITAASPTRTASPAARASPTWPPGSSAAWPAAP